MEIKNLVIVYLAKRDNIAFKDQLLQQDLVLAHITVQLVHQSSNPMEYKYMSWDQTQLEDFALLGTNVQMVLLLLSPALLELISLFQVQTLVFNAQPVNIATNLLSIVKFWSLKIAKQAIFALVVQKNPLQLMESKEINVHQEITVPKVPHLWFLVLVGHMNQEMVQACVNHVLQVSTAQLDLNFLQNVH